MAVNDWLNGNVCIPIVQEDAVQFIQVVVIRWIWHSNAEDEIHQNANNGQADDVELMRIAEEIQDWGNSLSDEDYNNLEGMQTSN